MTEKYKAEKLPLYCTVILELFAIRAHTDSRMRILQPAKALLFYTLITSR